MNTLKIEIPNGFEIDTFDQKYGEIKFKEIPKKPMDKIKTIDDILSDHGLTREQFYSQCEEAGLEVDEINYRILKMLVKSLNQEWTPNWDDSSQPKYVPWFYMGGSSGFRFYVFADWRSHSNVGSRLCFKSRELAEYAAKQFVDVYKNYMTK